MGYQLYLFKNIECSIMIVRGIRMIIIVTGWAGIPLENGQHEGSGVREDSYALHRQLMEEILDSMVIKKND